MVYKGRQHRQQSTNHRIQSLIYRGNRLAQHMEQLTNELANARQAARNFQAGRSLFQMSNSDREYSRMLSQNILNIQNELDRIRDLIEENDQAIEDAFNYFNLAVQEQDFDPEWND